jgi:hypothetical protein
MQRDPVQVLLPQAPKSLYLHWADWVFERREHGATESTNRSAVRLPDPLIEAVADFVAEWVWYVREQATGWDIVPLSPRLASEPVALLAASAYLQAFGEAPAEVASLHRQIIGAIREQVGIAPSYVPTRRTA